MAEPLGLGTPNLNARAFTVDGQQLILTSVDGAVLATLENKQVQPLLPQSGIPNAEVSPDGRWLAYESSESGRPAIHVRPFPKVNGGHWEISRNGGTKPLWARSGREVFYLDAEGMLTSVPVEGTTSLTFGNPTRLLNRAYYSLPDGRTYDVAADGKRFLMIEPAPEGDLASVTMTVVVNWVEELKARVP